MNKVYYFHAAPSAHKAYGDRCPMSVAAIVKGASSKAAAKVEAAKAMGKGLTISSGNECSDVAGAERLAARDRKLFDIKTVTVDMDNQRDIAAMLGM